MAFYLRRVSKTTTLSDTNQINTRITEHFGKFMVSEVEPLSVSQLELNILVYSNLHTINIIKCLQITLWYNLAYGSIREFNYF